MKLPQLPSRWIVLATVTAMCSHAAASDAAVEKLLGQMRQAYHAVKSAIFVAESHFPGQKGDVIFVNTFEFKSPSRIKLVITAPGQKRSDAKNDLIKTTDGDKIYFKVPGQTKGSTMPFSRDLYERNLPANLESFCFFDADRQLSTAKGMNMEHSVLKIIGSKSWNGKSWTLLQETAKAQNVLATYYVDPKTRLIGRTVIQALSTKQQQADCRITKLNLGAAIADSEFRV